MHLTHAFRVFNIWLKLKNKNYTHLLVGTPMHGNLGDQAISLAEKKFLKANNINFIEVTFDCVKCLQRLNLKNIKTICLHGGGNLGDEYLNEEYSRDFVIRKFKDKKIIIFPQTVFFKDTTNFSDFPITKAIFDSHPNLTVVAREAESFSLMKKYFPNNKVLLTPDIVLSMDCTKNTKRKNKILFLFRNDSEKKIKNDELLAFRNKIHKPYKVTMSDLNLNRNIGCMRNIYLKSKIKKIRKAKLVVTDRLHGMILSAITNTPCIVVSNYNHKIKSTYDTWLKKLPYICFTEKLTEVDLEKMLNVCGDWKALNGDFRPLKNELL